MNGVGTSLKRLMGAIAVATIALACGPEEAPSRPESRRPDDSQVGQSAGESGTDDQLVEQSAADSEARSPGEESPVRPVVVDLKGTVEGIPYRVVINAGPFDEGQHKITKSEEYDYVYNIDGGGIALGTDGGIPREQINSFIFEWRGEEIDVPARFWDDCFNPFLGNSPVRDIAVRRGPRPGTLFLLLGGSDAAGTYGAVWILSADGKHERWISHDEETIMDLLDAIDQDRLFQVGLWKGAHVVK